MDPAAAAAVAAATEKGIFSTAYLRACQNSTQPTTSIDVLEVTNDEESHVEIDTGLDHDAFVRRFSRPSNRKGPSLLMVFINFTPTAGGNRIVLASSETLKFFRDCFGVSLLFLDSLGPIQRGAKSGNACFNGYNDVDGVPRTDAFYHFHTEDRACDIWFSRRHHLYGKDHIYPLVLLCKSENAYHALRTWERSPVTTSPDDHRHVSRRRCFRMAQSRSTEVAWNSHDMRKPRRLSAPYRVRAR